MDYTLIRSKRKTVCLQIAPDLTVTVRAPYRMEQVEIDHFMEKHALWLETQRARLQLSLDTRRQFAYRDGDRLPYRGGELSLGAGGMGPARMEGAWLLVPPEGRPEAVAAFLRRQARTLVEGWIARHAPRMDVRPSGVRITSAATRWGSCSAKNGLCFSYRTACLPDELLEYVVVHELAHIREHNHSQRFWAVVAAALPDYSARRARLKEIGETLPV